MVGRKSPGLEGDADISQAKDSNTVTTEASNSTDGATTATIKKDGGRIVGNMSESITAIITTRCLVMLELIYRQVSIITDDEERMIENKDKESNRANPTLPVRHQDKGCAPRRHNSLVRGMQNLGNTCYFNAALQSLLAIDKLRMKMLEQDLPAQGTIHMELKKLFEETNGSNDAGGTLVPEKLYSYMCSKYPDFSLGEMGDSTYVIRSLLDGLSKEELDARNLIPTTIQSLFSFHVVKNISCENCGPKSVTAKEIDLNLAIPSKKTVSMKDCLEHYTEGKIDWCCTDCQKFHRSVKEESLIRKAPPVLIIQLKRFEYVQAGNKSNKLAKHVSFHKMLDINKFIERRPGENDNYMYRLVAVIAHTVPSLPDVPSLERGHFIAYVRASRIGGKQQKPGGSHSWFHASDAVIKGVPLKEVLSCEAYILFYERVQG